MACLEHSKRVKMLCVSFVYRWNLNSHIQQNVAQNFINICSRLCLFITLPHSKLYVWMTLLLISWIVRMHWVYNIVFSGICRDAKDVYVHVLYNRFAFTILWLLWPHTYTCHNLSMSLQKASRSFFYSSYRLFITLMEKLFSLQPHLGLPRGGSSSNYGGNVCTVATIWFGQAKYQFHICVYICTNVSEWTLKRQH